MSENTKHSIYKHCNIKEADGVAWAFVNKDKMVQFPFKFPPIGDDEIRVKSYMLVFAKLMSILLEVLGVHVLIQLPQVMK